MHHAIVQVIDLSSNGKVINISLVGQSNEVHVKSLQIRHHPAQKGNDGVEDIFLDNNDNEGSLSMIHHTVLRCPRKRESSMTKVGNILRATPIKQFQQTGQNNC